MPHTHTHIEISISKMSKNLWIWKRRKLHPPDPRPFDQQGCRCSGLPPQRPFPSVLNSLGCPLRLGAVQQNGRKQLVLLEPRKPTGTNTCGNHKDSHGSEVSNLEILYIHHRPWWKNLANSFFNNKNHINITSRTHLFSRSTLRQTGRSVRSGSGRIEKSKVSPFPHPLIKGLGWCTGKAGSIFLSWKSLILVTSTAK